jgi:hypothetical protein
VQGGLTVKLSLRLLGFSVALTLLLTSGICLAAKAPLYGKGNVLVGAGFNDGPGSSDVTLIMRLSGDGEIYVDEGSPVKYIHDPDNEGIMGWTEVGFNDSGWADGLSGVGFADSDDNTTTPSGKMSIWTRCYFDAPNADGIKELTLLADYDDEYIAYLNGVRIAASAGAPKEDPPAWDATKGGSSNHGASELPAGKPNAARWGHNKIVETVVDFQFAGSTAVEARDKLAITWGHLKK